MTAQRLNSSTLTPKIGTQIGRDLIPMLKLFALPHPSTLPYLMDSKLQCIWFQVPFKLEGVGKEGTI